MDLWTQYANDLAIRLESLRESWKNLHPGFRMWFLSKRKAIFRKSVIECARKNSNERIVMSMAYFITTALNAIIT